MKCINKRFFLDEFSNINDPNVIEKTVQLKNGSKFIFTAPRLVYTELDHKLYSSFCQRFTQVSLAIFFKYNPYYCVKPTEKEKLSCLWINCLNPHLLLQLINIYRKSKGLPWHDSLAEYIDCLSKGESFEEANDNKACKFYSYQRVVESYIVKEGKPVQYQRTASADDTKPVKHLVSLIKDGGRKYKKHQSYVDNWSTVFLMMKDIYNRKLIELGVSQNLVIQPKLEFQSAHFSNNQYTLHCAIAKPFDKRYHYHLSGGH